jgi:hypothetical protein
MKTNVSGRKTQIAQEYAYRLRDQSPETSIFWVHASSKARFEQSYHEIANHVKLPGTEDPKTNKLHLVKEWLRSEESSRWLLIVDSADDADMFSYCNSDTSVQGNDHAGDSVTLSAYLPQSPNGSIVITTRDMRAGLRLANRAEPIVIQQMDAREAQLLFCKTLRDISIDTDLGELIET